MRPLLPIATLLAALAPSVAGAHGIWGHIHVTGWAVENMPDDELRQFLLDDPEVFNALLFGTVFTDSGYARDVPESRAYSEHAHWEPFVDDYIEWMIANDPPPWTSLESKKRVAFLLGVASHGMQDEIFDSLFIYQCEERDGVSQEATDPGTDGFLALDEHIRFVPTRDIPMETVLELMQAIPEDITEDVIDDSVTLVTAAYINEAIGIPIAGTLGEQWAPQMPWGREHYMDPAVPGSLQSEIYPTMRYQQAVWARLHGDFTADDAVIYAFPEGPRRLRSGDATKVDSWTTLVFGAGVTWEGELVALLDDRGEPVPIAQGNTRWGADHTRLVRILPEEDLVPGAWYTARLRKGIQLIDGQTSTEEWESRFQVACTSDDDPRCPAQGYLPVAHIDGVHDPEPAVEESGCGCVTVSGDGTAPLLILAGILGLRRRD